MDVRKNSGSPNGDEPVKTGADCPIVGVGASAGGLEAYHKLLSGASVDDGLAYVVVQHLDPHHESLLGELLGRRTDLPVSTIKGGETVEANRIYLIPPGLELSIDNRVLRLTQFEEPRGRRRPIDTFFRSLAEDQGGNAACLVLSGTGADGSEGLRAIKAAGGLTIAQDPTGARYAGMPSSAMTTGLVDLVLSPEAMPKAVASYFASGQLPSDSELSKAKSLLESVVYAIRQRTGHDFTSYKKSSLLRRVARRMQILNMDDESEYLSRLMKRPEEAEQLFSDILINVTAFFRDPESFDALRQEVIPKLFATKIKGERVRVWVAGASSGEEAYSIAMLLLEERNRNNRDIGVEVFASDIDPLMTQRARHGLYPPTSLSEVPPDLVDRYFDQEEAGFRVSRELREVVRVSAHNLIKDPPFSKLDLVSCRNLLIYLEPELQRRVIPLFHYALRRGGYLFLGPSENITGQPELFEPVRAEHKIFERLDTKTPPVRLPSLGEAYREEPLDPPRPQPFHRDGFDETKLRDVILSRYVVPHVVVSSRGELLHSSNETARYLEFPRGRPSLNVQELARRNLRSVITTLLNQVGEETVGRRRVRDVIIDIEGEETRIDVTAEKLSRDAILIAFLEHKIYEGVSAHGDEPEHVTDAAAFDHRIRSLEQELSQTEQDLRTTVEELETSNEELKSSNEEMMSMNEELQSANEELTTVNDELQDKVAELARANADKANYLESTDIAVIFLDEDLHIKEYTPAATSIFKLVAHDVGRGLAAIRTDLPTEHLEEMIEEVRETGKPTERNFDDLPHGRAFLTRIIPYITLDGERDGFVITLTDVSEIKRIAANLEKARTDYKRQLDEVKEIYASAPQAMALLDSDRRYVRVNQRLAEINGVPVEQHYGKTIADVVPEIAHALEAFIDRVVETGQPVLGHEVMGTTRASEKERVFSIDCYPVKDDDEVVSVGLCVRDITEEREMETSLRRVMRELQHRVKNILANVSALMGQALRSDAEPDEKLAILSARVKSLAKTHEVLTERDWKAAPLSAVIEAELIQVYGSERVTATGPEIELGTKATLAMAMAFHELATNASKYGALSADDGSLEVSWWVFDRGQGATLQFEWKERGGPNVVEPDRSGFGSSLINLSVRRTLGGEIERDFAEDGLQCLIRIPLANLRDDGEQGTSDERAFSDPFSGG